MLYVPYLPAQWRHDTQHMQQGADDVPPSKDSVNKTSQSTQSKRNNPRPHGSQDFGTAGISQLQRSLGNQGMIAMLQAQLKVGASDDFYEKEADSVADAVMRQPSTSEGSPEQLGVSTSPPEISRLREGTLRRESNDLRGSFNTNESFDRTLSKSNVGNFLPVNLERSMGSKIGADFSGVRIHDNPASHEMSRAINANAFTHGNDIYFGEGQYHPDTTEGQRTIAHELTHTIQQNASTQRSGMSSSDKEETIQRDTSEPAAAGVFHPILTPMEAVGGGRVTNKKEANQRDLSKTTGNKGREHRVEKQTLDALNVMRQAAYADGIPEDCLLVCSGYRSQAEQDAIKARQPEGNGNKYVAFKSAHLTGRAVDLTLGYNDDPTNSEKIPLGVYNGIAFEWLKKNAATFGFYQYLEEPWHWEYNPFNTKTIDPSNAPELSRGAKNNDVDYVKKLQILLKIHKHDTYSKKGLPVGNFGPATEEAVINFQKEKGVDPADGVVTTKVWEALLQPPVHVSGQPAKEPVENSTQSAGNAELPIAAPSDPAPQVSDNYLSADNLFGQKTKEAVRQFQSSVKHPVTGISSAADRQALLNSPSFTQNTPEANTAAQNGTAKTTVSAQKSNTGSITGDEHRLLIDFIPPVLIDGKAPPYSHDVEAVQRLLIKAGYELSADGRYGNASNNALRHYKGLRHEKDRLAYNVDLSEAYESGVLEKENDKRSTLERMATVMLSEGYELAFVVGMLANVYYEGAVGKFEGSNYKDDNLKNKPKYLIIMDEKYDYGSKYSGKKITEVNLDELEVLLKQLESDNWENGKFGLGSIQWTGERTMRLFQYYRAEAGDSSFITLEQAQKAEEDFMLAELKGSSYTSIYPDWCDVKTTKDDKKNSLQYSNLNSSDAAKVAASRICRLYEKPKSVDTKVGQRITLAGKLYEKMAPST